MQIKSYITFLADMLMKLKTGFFREWFQVQKEFTTLSHKS